MLNDARYTILKIISSVGMFVPHNLSTKIQYLHDKDLKPKQELFVGQG